ncbi:TlpA disulfide reductase family protein [Mesobacterium sp. TK19101]|uniref:TlpA disulfide reductase family protein n=1 Tax=Mesobacterium hydrothermale TaxID=3111907 RepID=A0ABU6HGK8_9RHOB|nr:TlpA disulfide reductase family protein [Mesobacterium sp. TK19101]MEC3860889.1 TlpA disulfide reductase family protein [Mesobacterium sp. TK19101]
MKRLVFGIVYTALAALAIPAAADPSSAEALREGDMKKLAFHSDPQPVSGAEFVTFDGAPLKLSDWQGKWVLVNFWATWCAPCRHEMPMLSELQTELGGDSFEVVTIATGRNAPPALQKFFDEIGVDNLPMHRDPKQALARQMGILGLPITIVLNPEGQEIARMRGDADWSSDNAKAVLRALISPAG